jgi:hypothetical protein
MALAEPPARDSAPTRTEAPDSPEPEISAVTVSLTDDGRFSATTIALLYESFAFFMANLLDEGGRPFIVDEHQEEWADVVQWERFLVAMAPRDHGKTWTFVVAYTLWCIWRHNRDPQTGQIYEDLRDGVDETVVFSDTLPQAEKTFEIVQGILLANTHLFADLIPARRGGRRDVWAKRRMNLRNNARVLVRGYRTSTRGLHPTRIICDDVLNEQNTLTAYQRDKVWQYFVGTLVPMNPVQMIVVGTAFHFDDLLHRLRPTPKRPMTFVLHGEHVKTRWVKYRAVNWTTRTVLWPRRHSIEELEGLRRLDALSFSREYQNDPVDDSASLFPRALTQPALDAGESLTFMPKYERQAGDVVVVGEDLAIGAEASSDFTVAMVVAWNRFTGKRRLIWAERHHGLSITEQQGLLRALARVYDFDLAIVEENGFQRWLLAEVKKDGQLNGRVLGHRTGQEKADFEAGVPALRIAFENKLWVVPVGDERAAEYALIWQTEMAAYGWKDGKLTGVGEHDDTVMSTYFVERAIRTVEEWLRKAAEAEEEYVHGEDIGIERVRIGPDYP